MKKIILLSCILLFRAITTTGQSNATDFNATDCNSMTHHLYSELDAGKVIVIAWVMPCATCITDPLTAYYDVQSYATSHPGQVIFYMADDYANTTCSTLSSWAANNGMGSCTKFSDAAVNMGDYGQAGMPKIVVLGGTDHTVYYNQNSSSQGIDLAINQALADLTTGLKENSIAPLEVNTFPNPANNLLNISYELDRASSITIEIYNLLGVKVISHKNNSFMEAGEFSEKIDLSKLSNGIYFLKINNVNNKRTLKFTVYH